MSQSHSDEYLAESKQPDLYAAVTITYTGAFAAVMLRLWSRKLKGAKYWLDDWLIMAAQVCATAMLVNICWWTSRGYGRHREASGPDIDYNFFLGFFMAEIIYTFIITFVKYSILALYWRIFGRESIQWPVYALAFIATAWGIAVLFLAIFTCVPPKAFWDKSVTNAKCGVDQKMFLWGISIPNIVTDVSILLLPIPYVLQLSTSWSQKKLLLGTFFLGGFVCIASVMRLISVVQQDQGPDAPWNWVSQGLWAITEGHFAIISGGRLTDHTTCKLFFLTPLPACLPTLRPVWVHALKSSTETQPSTVSGARIWTIGGSGSSSDKKKRKMLDESLLATMSSTSHPFSTIDDNPDGSMEGMYASERSVQADSGGLRRMSCITCPQEGVVEHNTVTSNLGTATIAIRSKM